MLKGRFFHFLFLLVFLVGIFSGCTRDLATSRAKREGILLLGNGPEPQSLDPHITSGTAELNIQMALYEGLLTPDPVTLDPQPGMAESWDVSEDGLVYTFHLRRDALWSDGVAVTAHDFVTAWKRVLTPGTGAPNASMLYLLKGAEAFNKSDGTDFSSVGVAALDDHTLSATLEKPVPYLLSTMLHPIWYPVPSHIAKSQDPGERVGQWSLPGSFVGNGAFVLMEWLPNQYVEVMRNELYWDSNTVFLEGVRFMSISEPGAEERAFQAGQLHLTDSLPPARVAAYTGNASVNLRIDPYLGTYYIIPNVREGVLADAKVRRALALSIDRVAIAEQLLGAGQRPAGGFVPDIMPGYDSTIPVEYDPASARSILADAGYPAGKGFPKLEYMFNSSENHRQIAEALQSMWAKELGIEVILVNQEWRTYLQRRTAADFELARGGWIGDYLEPSTFLSIWTTGHSNNFAGWENASYDALYEAALETGDLSHRMRAYALAERYMIAEQAIIPLFHYVTIYLKDPSVTGWHSNLLDWHPLKHVAFE